MAETDPYPPAAALKRQDVYFALFRYQRLIGWCALAGLAVAAVIGVASFRTVLRGGGMIEADPRRATEALRQRLDATEEELRQAKAKAGVIAPGTLDDTKKSYLTDRSKTREALRAAEAELAECQAALADADGPASPQIEAKAAALGISLDQLNAYRTAGSQLATLLAERRNLLVKFTEESPVVQRVQQMITQAQTDKQTLERDQPRLKELGIAFAASPQPGDPVADPNRAQSLQAKITALNTQWQRLQAEAANLDQLEALIVQLQRRRDLEETNYRQSFLNLEKSRRSPAPSPPRLTAGRLIWRVAAPAGGGVLAGVTAALVLGLFLNRSITRSSELASRFGAPLLLSIPNLNFQPRGQSPAAEGPPSSPTSGNEAVVPSSRALPTAPRRKESRKSTIPSVLAESVPPSVERLPAAPAHHDEGPLHAYCAALRDRLTAHLEAEHPARPPRLVAVTSCHEGAGVTSIAAGLAAAFSELGPTRALLVVMDPERDLVAALGKPLVALPDLLDLEDPQVAQLRPNLYLASAAHNPSGILARFSQLLPKLQAAGFDYVILDAPPVQPTTITCGLSALAHATIVVVEAEKTHREALDRTLTLLSQPGATLGTVLNKARKYVPAWLYQEPE